MKPWAINLTRWIVGIAVTAVVYWCFWHYATFTPVVITICVVMLDAKFAPVWQDPVPKLWTAGPEFLLWLLLIFGFVVFPWYIAERIRRMVRSDKPKQHEEVLLH